ncbi:DNA mismatch repair protein MutT [Ureibacillus massiliensis 4400831 = CIP 108448 = CCUG 49529]|uniref:8-oxo-dGTP diphosphatase n=1 Tax=Ureibacillus massiliensis 4400831 = CIP 108448 = CCUG 49529 TaxID=1211035 RepID=A0A0A3JV27_9BACL|nr:(deoxy)nucleoside triphosphate pyrophosphohydrolase [Ureibacillus massiliensis]KGR90842.1 DNA mismatch repair protein MutT [Ureibacillus massiliensis 4400831 = CIP 108448 = CCUG 49529]
MKKTVHVVGAIIENEKNEIFCALRGPEMSLPNYWEFPGGKIEDGETPERALAREIKEEFNCSIEVGAKVEDTTYEYEKVTVRLETYMAKLVDGEPVALEHAEAKWVSREEITKLDFAPADIPAVEKIANQNNLKKW